MHIALLSLLSALMISRLYAAEDFNLSSEVDLFSSAEDGMLDISEYLATRYGFMPVPMVITEPAVGYGGGLTILFLHDTFGSSLKRKSPPSMTGVIAVATENKTWAGGAFHMGYWLEDSIRSTTAVGVMNVNMDFYPIGDIGLDLNTKGYMGYQELMFRVGESNFFLGGNYAYVTTTISSNREKRLGEIINGFEPDIDMGALATILQYDSRDSTFTPSEGLFAKLTLRRFDEHFGGQQNFWRNGLKAFYFISALDTLIIGLRAEAESVSASEGDHIPIYSYPSIIMRGIPAMRYQGEHMAMAELQLRWEFVNRWNLVGFGGAGKTFGSNSAGLLNTSFSDAPTHPAGGVGFRYEIARKFGLWSGMDFATSEERNFTFYFTVGSAWGAF